MGEIGHGELVRNLADYLEMRGSFALTEFYVENSYGAGDDFPIIDVWSYGTIASKLAFAAYEIKVNRSDLLQDIKKQKYLKYLRYCNRFYFAYPKGLADKSEIPPVAGIYEFDLKSHEWESVRGGRPLSSPNFDTENMVAFLRRNITTTYDPHKFTLLEKRKALIAYALKNLGMTYQDFLNASMYQFNQALEGKSLRPAFRRGRA